MILTTPGSSLEKGREYLIDADREADGRLDPHACGSTLEVSDSDAQETLDYLRQRAAGRTKTTFGIGVRETFKPVPDALVTIDGPDGKRTVRTDLAGNVQFDGLAPGSYRIKAEKEHYRPDTEIPSDEQVTVLQGACTGAGINLSTDAMVSGKVLSAKGVPVPDLKLTLVEVPPVGLTDGWPGRPMSFAVTGANGVFRFDGVSPGRYYLGTNITGVARDSPIPRTYYPGRREQDGAEPVEVDGSVSGLTMVLPDFGEPREIQICVVGADGWPVPGAGVYDSYLKAGDDFARLAKKLVTNEGGCVQADGLTGAAYALQAFFSSGKTNLPESLRQTRTSEVTVINPGKDAVHVVLVLKDSAPPVKH